MVDERRKRQGKIGIEDQEKHKHKRENDDRRAMSLVFSFIFVSFLLIFIFPILIKPNLASATCRSSPIENCDGQLARRLMDWVS